MSSARSSSPKGSRLRASVTRLPEWASTCCRVTCSPNPNGGFHCPVGEEQDSRAERRRSPPLLVLPPAVERLLVRGLAPRDRDTPTHGLRIGRFVQRHRRPRRRLPPLCSRGRLSAGDRRR